MNSLTSLSRRKIGASIALTLGLIIAPVSAAHAVNGGLPRDTVANPSSIVKINSTAGSCTGSLIAAQWVLTAKHCTTSDWTYKVDRGDGKTVKVDIQAISPSGADVALLHLAAPLAPGTVEGSEPRYVSLQDELTPYVWGGLFVTGYGLHEEGPGQYSSGKLWTGQADIYSRDTKKVFVKPSANTELRGSADFGDSGGPLIQYVNGVATAIGVAATTYCSTYTPNESCDWTEKINLYTSVLFSDPNKDGGRSVRAWIRDTTGV